MSEAAVVQRAEWKGHCCRVFTWHQGRQQFLQVQLRNTNGTEWAAHVSLCDFHCPEQIHAQAAMTALPQGGTHKRE